MVEQLTISCRQTADTFQAAATFLDLCQIWGPFEPETASKIKFAKYHALRIAKAIKANEDPNLSNPAPEPQPTLDPNDPDVQMLNSLGESVRYQDASRQPSVVEVPDEYDRLQGQLANRSTRGESFHPSRAPSVPPPSAQDYQLPTPREPEENYYHDSAPPEVSPLAPSTADRTMSDGGGYFPRVSESDDEVTDSRMPDAVAEDERSSSMVLPDFSSLPPPTPSAAPDFRSLQHRPMDSLHSFPPPEMDKSSTSPPSHISVPSYPSAPPPAVSAPSYRPYPPPTASRQIPQTPIQPPLPMPGAPVKQAPLPRAMAPPQVVGQAYLTDEEAILNAQKHARWAISALNFEDADTAVKELREALEALGAS